MSTSLSSCLVRSAIYPCFLATARLSADGSSLYSPASMSLGPVTGYCYGKSSQVGLLTRRVVLFCGLDRTRVGHLSGPVCNGSLGQRTTLEVEAAVFRGRILTSRHTRFQVHVSNLESECALLHGKVEEYQVSRIRVRSFHLPDLHSLTRTGKRFCRSSGHPHYVSDRSGTKGLP